MNTREATLYLSAHPDTSRLVIPVLGFFLDHPRTYLLARKGWSLVSPVIHTIPVDISKYPGQQDAKSAIEHTLIALFRPTKQNPPDPIHSGIDVIAKGKSILMFPAGKVSDSEEQPWRRGVGEIVKKSLEQKVDPWISFFYVNGLRYLLSEPQRASTLITSSQSNLEISALLRASYIQQRETVIKESHSHLQPLPGQMEEKHRYLGGIHSHQHTQLFRQ